MNVNTDFSSVKFQMPKASIPSKPSPTAGFSSAGFESTDSQAYTASLAEASEDFRNYQQDMAEAMAQVKNHIETRSFRLSLDVDDRTNRTVARIIDKESGEVIKEIPQQEILDLAAKLKETAQGIMLDTVS